MNAKNDIIREIRDLLGPDANYDTAEAVYDIMRRDDLIVYEHFDGLVITEEGYERMTDIATEVESAK